jgi:NhaP-type Na+/H+ or K+/H+ antiporter
MIVIVAAFAGLFLGVLIAFVRRAVRKAGEDPVSAGQFAQLKTAWAWRA